MAHRLQYRRDTKANWLKYNPVLMEGEVGYETDTHHQKVGDGVSKYSELEYEVGVGNITQETGDSETLVMSQKAVTDAIPKIVNDLTTGGADKALSAEMGKELNNGLRTIIGGEAPIKTIGTTLHSGWNKYLFVIPFDGENVGYDIETKIYCKDIPDGTYSNILTGYVGSYTNPTPTLPITFKDGYAILDGYLLTSANVIGWRLGTAGTAITLTSDSTLEIIKKLDSKLGKIEVAISDLQKVGSMLQDNLKSIIGGEVVAQTIHTTLHTSWNKYLFDIPFDGENVGYGISTKVYCKDIPDGTYSNILTGYVGSYTNPTPTLPITFKDGYAILDGYLLQSSNATGWRLGTAGADINLTSDSTLEIIKNYDSKLDEIDGRISENSNQISEVNEKIELTEEDIENLSDKIEFVNSIDEDINGKIELSLVGIYNTTKHERWGTYAFLIPFTEVIQKDVVLTIYCKDVPDGTYPKFGRGYVDDYVSGVSGDFELTFKGGYAIFDGTSITNERTNGWIVGTAFTTSPITKDSKLEVYVSKKVSNGLKDEVSELKANADFYQEKGADYYQKLWSTMNCTPYMLKKYEWYNQFNWNLNIGFNTDSHDESPEIFSRINRWYKCYEGRNKQSNNAIYCMWSLGDTLSAVPDTKPKAIARWGKVYQSLDDIGSTQRPQLFTIGNHDINQDGTEVSQYFTREDKYKYIIEPMLIRYSSNHTALDSEGTFSSWNKLPIVTPNVEYPTMWMLDNETEKLRMVSLDCYDWEDEELSVQVRSFKCGYFSARQIDFLIDCLNSVPQGYSVVVGSHHVYTGSANGGYKSGQLVRSILTAYRNKTTFTGDLLKVDDTTYVKTYNVDFASSNGRLFRVIGHDHIFSSRNEGDSSVGNLTFPSFTMISANAMGALYRGIYIDQFDMLCYNDEEGIRFVRYGGVGSQKDCKNNDGGDEKGFHFINSPIKV